MEYVLQTVQIIAGKTYIIPDILSIAYYCISLEF